MSISLALLLLACQAGPVGSGDSSDPGDLRDGALLIEAEHYFASEPSAPDGARVLDEVWASGRVALIRFPKVERMDWRLRAPAAGDCELWLRYAAAGGGRVRWAIDGAWSETRVPPTGGFEGRGAWSWFKLGSLELARSEPGASEHTLSLAGAPIRPDCLALVPAGAGAPAWPRTPAPTALSAEQRARLLEAPPRSEATWWAASEAARLPAWIERDRAGLHTRLSVAWTETALFTEAEASAAELGARSITRFVKSMNGQCFWTSEWGAAAPWVESRTADGVDPVGAMASRARERGLAFVAYYRHGEDRPLAEAHPDWVCRDFEGRAMRRAGELRLCFHSPYAEVSLGRLRELAARGASGVYLDESHQPLEGCWCPWTAAAFAEATGLPLPAAPLLEDPLYRRFLGFTEDTLASTLFRWREQLRAVDPEFVLLISTQLQPSLVAPLPTLRLAGVADVVKTEFRLGAHPGLLDLLAARPELDPPGSGRPDLDDLLTLGWATSRDGAFGRPAHVWVHGLKGADRWRAAAVAVLASGCFANLDHPEASLPDPGDFAPAFAAAAHHAGLLGGTRPLPDIALHLPERARNELLAEPARAWELVLGPHLAAWSALAREHRPARILSDDQLDQGLPEGTRLVFLPLPAAQLEARQRKSLEAFAEAGGVVVESNPEQLVESARALQLPARLEAPAEVRATWLRGADGAFVLALTNSPSWLLDPASEAPAPVTGARLALRASGQLPVRGWTICVDGEPPRALSLEGRFELELPEFQDGLTLRFSP